MKNTARWRMWTAVLVLGLGATAMAGYTYTVNGLKVTLSAEGGAFYDSDDGTVTVEPYWDYSTIKITAGRYAPGGYADVFIYAHGVVLKSISMKGSSYTWLYTTGQTWHCYTLKTTNTNIGNTYFYGRDVGLGMISSDVEGWPWPVISLKYGVGFGAVLAGEIFLPPEAKTGGDVSLPEEGRKLLFGK